MTEREKILNEAKTCVCGHREQDYGSPENNFRVIAELWTGYLGDTKLNPDSIITPLDVSMMMALLKIARIRSGGGSGDSFVDLAGYAACGGEIYQRENARMPYKEAVEEFKRDVDKEILEYTGSVPKGSVIANYMEQSEKAAVDKDPSCEKVIKPRFYCKKCKYSDAPVNRSPCNECCMRSGIHTKMYDLKYEPCENLEVYESVEDILCKELDLVKCRRTYDTAFEIVDNLTKKQSLD